jgi:hypothetical protein
LVKGKKKPPKEGNYLFTRLSRIIGPLKRKIFTQEVAENLGELIRPRG